LKDYLQDLTLKKEYKAKKASASLTMKKKQNEYVLQQLHDFDDKVNITIPGGGSCFFWHYMKH